MPGSSRWCVSLKHLSTEIQREFGDLWRKVTWEKAFCRFRSLNAKIGLVDACTLILSTFNFKPEDEDYEYRYQIFEEFLTLPNGLELIKLGLERLFSVNFTPEERGEAHGFLELVQGRAGGELSGDSGRLAWERQSSAGAS